MSDFKTEGMKVEIVEWIDSNMTTRWDGKGEYETRAKDPMECRSCGWVMYEADDRICLLQSESNNCFSQLITIPKVAITKRTVLVVYLTLDQS